MPARPGGGATRRLCRALLPAPADLTDGQLLDRFLAHRDEAAFEALVRRHGPMVLGTCRRVLGNPHDADDAFQATFVVLVRKVRELTGRATVGDFLYGVAYHTALKARARAVKRRTNEARATAPAGPAADPAERADLLRLLDRELARLPGKYREPVVLCDIEGRPRAEVAALLGIPEGTLSSRLTHARRTLAERLSRHGLAVSAGALAAALGDASAGVPAPLVGATVRAAVGGVVPVAVANLSAEMAKMMLLGKLKTGLGWLTAVAVIGTAVGLAAVPGEQPVPKPQPPAKAEKPAAKPDDPPWQKEFNKFYALAEGEVLKRVVPPYPAARTEYFKAEGLLSPRTPPAENGALIVRWDGRRAKPWSLTSPSDAKKGFTVMSLLSELAGIEADEVDAPSEFRLPDVESKYWLSVPCDFVVREGTPAGTVTSRLQEILRKDFGLHLSMTLRQEEREVIVARGNYKPAPLPNRDESQVEVYAKRPFPGMIGPGSGSGALTDLLKAVGRFIDKRIVNEAEIPPRKLTWTTYLRQPFTEQTTAEDTDPDAVLKNVAAQTGLTFTTEKRKVRVLVIEKADEKKEEAWRAEFHKVYGLADGEVLKRVPPPFPPARAVYCRNWAGTKALGSADGVGILFRWDGKEAEGWSLCTRGFGLQGLLNVGLDIPPYEVEGDRDLLATVVEGDVIVRTGAPAEKLLPALERVFREATGRRVKLTLREAEREVAVAKGKLAPRPLAGFPANTVALFARPPFAPMAPPETTPPVGPAPPARGLTVPRGGGEGSLADLLRHAAEFTGRRVVNEAEAAPGVKLTWREYYRAPATDREQAADRAPELVLANVAAQTGLTFTTEKRKVRVLIVEKADD